MKQLALDLVLPAAPALDNFVAGRNAELVESLRRLVASGAAERFIYLWGEPGGGRSHLLKATVSAVQAGGSVALYVGGGYGVRIPTAAAEAQCVALDDVDRLDPEAQVGAFHLYNALREKNGALLAAGLAPPVQLPLRSDLLTRLAWGLVYQVSALTDEEKAQTLAARAFSRGFRLPPEVGRFLLTRVSRDLPSLMALIDALDRYAMETKRPVTVPLARELLSRREAGLPAVRDPDRGGAN